MAQKTVRSDSSIGSALFQYGERLFRLCYLHTKDPAEAEKLLADVFLQYAVLKHRFRSERERGTWLLKTVYRALMDWYASKPRRTPARSVIRQKGEGLPFLLTDELCDIMRLRYTYLTPLVLVVGDGMTEAQAARLTARPAGLVRRRIAKALEKLRMDRSEAKEWLDTVILPEDVSARVLYDLHTAESDPHFSLQTGAASLRRGFRHSAPYIALAVLALCLLAFLAVRMDWFGLGVPTEPSGVPEGGSQSAAAPASGTSAPSGEAPAGPAGEGEPSRAGALPSLEPASPPGDAARLNVSLFIPNETGLTEYDLRDMEADGAVLVREMAARGAFPDDVELLGLTYLKDGRETDSVRTGDRLEVRLYFTASLQDALDGSPTSALAEALAKTFRSFYDAAGMPLYTLEIYAGDAPLSSNGRALDCTALLTGELPVTEVIGD